jgi:pyruvate-formate lyase-activating enzyme
MIKGSINSIESMGLVDGPGIRCVVFLNGCKLRCKYCHNPETWTMKELNITPEELVNKIKRFKPYYKNKGGVTFSGGEPLLQPDFLIECSKLLKKENLHIALDTAGCGIGKYDEILENIDLVFTSEFFDTSFIDNGNDELYEIEKIKIFLTTSMNQKNNENEKTIKSKIKYFKK